MVREVHVAHILVATEKEAKSLKDRIASGENFGQLAKKFSQCPSGKEGGDLHWVRPGMMVEQFDKAIFAGKKGDLIGPVKTKFGWHVIKILEER
ncbi:Parvulin-like peptidyl-prolyl isomerase [Thermoplasmatales archaeon BRNA1]|nr:Parvulin-like peptidyl-prolyl isomerase [Thermoplasmatales archaeon BRNA1]